MSRLTLSTAVLLALALPLGSVAQPPDSSPRAGVFLVANDDLADPRFTRTVVLLLAYGEEGAIGVIINRPTGHDLADLAPEEEVPKPCPLYFGGPVKMDGVITLVRTPDPPDGAVQIFGDVVMTELSESDGREARYYIGHSGWGPGQLQREVDSGAWTLRSANARYVFDIEPERIWDSLRKWDMTSQRPPTAVAGMFPVAGPAAP